MADNEICKAAVRQDGKAELPEAFLTKMKTLLGDEYTAFLESYGTNRTQGMRLNPLKVRDMEERQKIIERFGLKKIPWTRDGYYYSKEFKPGRHCWHDAGAYYIQEPSAMAVAEHVDAKPGDRILDLCAAPGGKTAQIAGQLLGQGLLVSNEIHPARARILSQNVERMGITNGVVANEDAKTLAGRFPCFFDRIVVDAPCSGEGMFRKDENAKNQWSLENVAMCAARQAEILDHAGAMLRPGGRLVYSTCTFSPEENEGSIAGFLERNPEFSIESPAVWDNFDRGKPQWVRSGPGELAYTVRIWPHHTDGEGHYLAVLRKSGQAADGRARKTKKPPYVKDRQVKEIWRDFCADTLTEEGTRLFCGEAEERLVLFGEQLYLIPSEMPDYAGLRILRAGLHLGAVKKKRFEPSHGLALCLKKEQVKRWQAWDAEGSKIRAYVQGETLEAPGGGSGWVVMAADDFSIGWAKQAGGLLKNHYPKGLRHG